jgi:hypothetical protein
MDRNVEHMDGAMSRVDQAVVSTRLCVAESMQTSTAVTRYCDVSGIRQRELGLLQDGAKITGRINQVPMIVVGGQLVRQLDSLRQFSTLGARNKLDREVFIGGDSSAAIRQIDKSASQRPAKDTGELCELRDDALGVGQRHSFAHALPC